MCGAMVDKVSRLLPDALAMSHDAAIYVYLVHINEVKQKGHRTVLIFMHEE